MASLTFCCGSYMIIIFSNFTAYNAHRWMDVHELWIWHVSAHISNLDLIHTQQFPNSTAGASTIRLFTLSFKIRYICQACLLDK